MWSVVNYACRKAVEKNQNACATWLGPTNDSHSFAIFASSLTAVVPIAYWGMCTDRANTSSMMEVMADNDSIADGNAYNFTRSGSWGSPTSKQTTLDVAKFIQGLSPIVINGHTGYRRRVMVDRAHSDGQSMGLDFSWIWVEVGEAPPVPPEETPEIICARWAPSGFTGANAYHGTTTIDVRIKNMNSRFGGVGFGDWNTDIIYAMPTDEIRWIECYYGGTPGTGHTKVSSINGQGKTYAELSGDWCHTSSSGAVWVPAPGYYPYENVGSTPLSVSYYELWSRSPVWQNQFNIWGAGKVVRSGDSVANGSFNVFVNQSAARRNGYITSEGQAGQTFTESGQTGAPKSVNIVDVNESKSIDKSYYVTYETDYSSPKTCTVDTIFGPVVVTSGDYCGYNTYPLAHYDGHSCTNRYASTPYDARVDYSPHSDNASVLIPYNYINYTGVNIHSGEVYSGETVIIDSVWTETIGRDNSVTLATYATQVPDAKLRLFGYVTADPNGGGVAYRETSNGNGCDLIGSAAKQCLRFKSKSGFTLNGSGSLSGASEEFSEMGGTFNAFDASAGDYLCFVSAVWPSETAGDTDMGSGGNGKWRYSAPSCVIIAKKPTFQVWGGSMYGVGSVNAYVGQKRNLYSYYISSISSRFKKTGGSSTFFNPWVEEALVLKNGTTGTVASGAAAGINSSTRAGVGATGEFCANRAPLSFSNFSTQNGGPCKNTNTVGRSGINAITSNREELIDYWTGANGGSVNTGNDVTLNLANPNSVGTEIKTASNAIVRYAYSNGNLTVGGTVPHSAATGSPYGTTYLIKSKGDVTINRNIIYSGSYTSFNNVSKVVIYAKNINIQCNVTEVDAILITASGGEVDTCSTVPDDGDVNNRNRSRQLRIFGTVMADAVDLKRTYGAAANQGGRKDPYGIPSDGAAAEIFDYDSTILMWSEYMSGSGETDTLQSVYQHELAPRY